MSLFLDTSGLLASFLDHGRATAALLEAWRVEQVVVIAMHADLEFMHEVNQLQLAGTDMAACLAVAEAYQDASKDFVRRPTDTLYLRAAILGIKHALAPGPSLHLMAAMDFRDQILRQLGRAQDPVVFGSLDPGLVLAARREGFRVVP